MSQHIGFRAEEEASYFLCAQGLTLIIRNYRCPMGEIDLIMRDKEYLVFVEVRARASNVFGGAMASITLAKRRKLTKSASFYLNAHKLQNKMMARFDVVGIEGKPARMEWIKNAFEATH